MKIDGVDAAIWNLFLRVRDSCVEPLFDMMGLCWMLEGNKSYMFFQEFEIQVWKKLKKKKKK